MALIFITIDPETDSDHCPAVFVEEETGPTVPGLDRHEPSDTGRSEPTQSDRRQRICGQAPGAGCGQPSWRRSVGTVPPFSELIAATASSAVHLEMRDAYTPDDQRFLGWRASRCRGQRIPRGLSLSGATRPEECGSAVLGSFRSRSRTTSASSTLLPMR